MPPEWKHRAETIEIPVMRDYPRTRYFDSADIPVPDSKRGSPAQPKVERKRILWVLLILALSALGWLIYSSLKLQDDLDQLIPRDGASLQLRDPAAGQYSLGCTLPEFHVCSLPEWNVIRFRLVPCPESDSDKPSLCCG